MPIPAIPPVGSVAAATGAAGAPAVQPLAGGADFGQLLSRGLEHVSDLERSSDAAAAGFAVGDGTTIGQVMTAGTKSQLAVEMLAQIRNKAVEAYGEIMRMQV